jgi:hypothetical protein
MGTHTIVMPFCGSPLVEVGRSSSSSSKSDWPSEWGLLIDQFNLGNIYCRRGKWRTPSNYYIFEWVNKSFTQSSIQSNEYFVERHIPSFTN